MSQITFQQMYFTHRRNRFKMSTEECFLFTRQMWEQHCSLCAGIEMSQSTVDNRKNKAAVTDPCKCLTSQHHLNLFGCQTASAVVVSFQNVWKLTSVWPNVARAPGFTSSCLTFSSQIWRGTTTHQIRWRSHKRTLLTQGVEAKSPANRWDWCCDPRHIARVCVCVCACVRVCVCACVYMRGQGSDQFQSQPRSKKVHLINWKNHRRVSMETSACRLRHVFRSHQNAVEHKSPIFTFCF